MSGENEMKRVETPERKQHGHRRKFTEGLLNSEAVLKALDIKPGQTILDAGCGNGYMSKQFSDTVAPSGKVYALDTDKYYIEMIQNEAKDTNIIAIAADITKPTQLKQSSVDLIYISTVIHGFSKQQIQSFFKEVNRLLKPDGILAIVEIEKAELPFGPPVEIKYSPEELKAIVPMHPLDTVNVGDHFYMQIFQKKENR